MPSHGRAPVHVPSACDSGNGGLVKRARLPAFATHDEIDEVAACAAFVEPELPQTVFTRLVSSPPGG